MAYLAYDRVIEHLDTDASTVLSTISSRTMADPKVISANYELNRIGFCGAGSVTLKDDFISRGTFSVGEYIRFKDKIGGSPVYLGRIESVEEKSPSVVNLSLYGPWSVLSEIWPGGFGASNEGKPHLYAKSDNFPDDPDKNLRTWDVIQQPDSVVDLLFDQYIGPATNITKGTIDGPNIQRGFQSATFRGEESVASILRQLALIAKDSSVGVDADNKFHFIPRKSGKVLLNTIEGEESSWPDTPLQVLVESNDKEFLYNRLLLTGDYVYLPSHPIKYYRYMATFRQQNSITRNGERRFRAYVPWIRRNADAIEFAREFFRKYANPRKKLRIRFVNWKNSDPFSINPWDGEIRVYDDSQTAILRAAFESVKLSFDEIPIAEIIVGPEDAQFAEAKEPQRWEIGQTPPNALIPSLPSIPSSSSSSSSGTLPSDACQCDSSANDFEFTIAGITHNFQGCTNDECDEYNGTWTLKNIGGGSCQWKTDETCTCGSDSECWNLQFDAGSDIWRLQAIGTGGNYTATTAAFNCFDGGTFTLAGSGVCKDYPATVVVLPV